MEVGGSGTSSRSDSGTGGETNEGVEGPGQVAEGCGEADPMEEPCGGAMEGKHWNDYHGQVPTMQQSGR